jgi:hypothetical protein
MVTARVVGHGMPFEGRGLSWSAAGNCFVVDAGSTQTRCECGEWSPPLPSVYARRKWHRAHKAGLRDRT